MAKRAPDDDDYSESKRRRLKLSEDLSVAEKAAEARRAALAARPLYPDAEMRKTPTGRALIANRDAYQKKAQEDTDAAARIEQWFQDTAASAKPIPRGLRGRKLPPL